MKKYFDSLTLLLGKLCFPVSAICVSETWTVSDSEQDYCIPGYTFYGKSRRGKIGGGVGIYVSETIDCIVRSDLDLNNDSVESIFIELVSMHTVLGCVYRPPNTNVDGFMCTFDDILSLLNSQKNSVTLPWILILIF